jgi:hypothetical protein
MCCLNKWPFLNAKVLKKLVVVLPLGIAFAPKVMFLAKMVVLP